MDVLARDRPSRRRSLCEIELIAFEIQIWLLRVYKLLQSVQSNVIQSQATEDFIRLLSRSLFPSPSSPPVYSTASVVRPSTSTPLSLSRSLRPAPQLARRLSLPRSTHLPDSLSPRSITTMPGSGLGQKWKVAIVGESLSPCARDGDQRGSGGVFPTCLRRAAGWVGISGWSTDAVFSCAPGEQARVTGKSVVEEERAGTDEFAWGVGEVPLPKLSVSPRRYGVIWGGR